ncbi:beta-1,4-galactosyltransferase galt-1-like [Latimeria chalumnae]|uniref:beta-1,4-galactosyltransferase galt-1-like n=1 Tax=Latimeria chalumnae TaxID=7897 RepID=UPI00313BE81F
MRSITPISNTKVYIIAPYFDNREKNVTRVLAIAHYRETKDIFCTFNCKTDSNFTTKAEINVHADRFGFPYATTDLICSEPDHCDPETVYIHGSEFKNGNHLFAFPIMNRKPREFSFNFSICISTLHSNYNNVLQFIQSIEMYRILGAQKVFVYKENCSPMLEKTIQYYSKEGIIEVIDWPIGFYFNLSRGWRFSKHPGEIGYHGQIATLNDCVYRNMYRSKYVLLNDIDEIILPIKHQDWHKLMVFLEKAHPHTGVFLIQNHIFPKTQFDENNPFKATNWSAIPGVNILNHVYREPINQNMFNPTKMIVNPRMVIQTSVHSVLKSYGKHHKVPSEIAYIFHCRVPLQGKLPKQSLIRDTIMWRYNHSLIKNVDKVIEQSEIWQAQMAP